MNFRNIIRIAEDEVRNHENVYINKILNRIMNRFNNEVHEKNSSLKQTIKDIENDIFDYTQKQSHTSVKTKTIEYYLSKRFYSTSKYNLNKAYKEVCQDIIDGKIDVESTAKEDVQYTYNLDEDMKMLIANVICKIRLDKDEVHNYLRQHDIFREYPLLSNKSKNIFLKDISRGDKNVQDAYKNIMRLSDKNEKEILEAELRKYTEKVSDDLKSECISSIRNNVELLDSYGLIEDFVDANNTSYKNIYLFNCDYTYEETMNLLSEKKLKELSVEQLIGMTAYWDNRTAKVINEISKATYILSHPELYESKTTDDGKSEIKVTKETLKNIHLKMNILQKINFEVFDEAEWLMDDDTHTTDINYEIDEVCEKYEREYKSYLDKKLIYSKNELRDDVVNALKFQNPIYNLYAIKSSNMQALLISALNSGTDYIQNFGVIEDQQKDIKNFIIIGIDIPGMNMPLRLHIRESNVVEVLKSAQNGNVQFSVYQGADDFIYKGNNYIIPAQIYVPTSEEKAKKFKEAAGKINEKDKYANTIRHLAYIAGKGKMPEHLSGAQRTYELKDDEEERIL